MAAEARTENKTGSPLLGRLKQDLKDAVRGRDAARRDTIRQIMAEFPKLTVPITLESGKKSTRLKTAAEISDDDIVGIIRGLAKSERTVLEMTGKDSSAYLQILQGYLPQMADRQAVAAWIRENIDFTRYADRMQAMGTIMAHFGKTADGRMVSALLKEWEEA